MEQAIMGVLRRVRGESFKSPFHILIKKREKLPLYLKNILIPRSCEVESVESSLGIFHRNIVGRG
jgi:hypothetical protein